MQFFDDTADQVSKSVYSGYDIVRKGDWKPIRGAAVSKDLASGMRDMSSGFLPFAAEAYNISPKLEDYVIVPVPIIISDLPNRKGRAFPLRSLTEFQPEVGAVAYKTWVGKGTYYEHDNKDPLKAKGIIIDVVLRPRPEWQGNLYTVDALLGFDRTKDPKLARRIINGELSTYSMGSRCTSYTCSICGTVLIPNRVMRCAHVGIEPAPARILKGGLAFTNINTGLQGLETSAVETPAMFHAASRTVFW